MAGFPQSVNMYPAKGVPGAFASINPIVSTPLGYTAGADVTIGAFCWEDTSNKGSVVNTGTGAPLGFVVREVTNPIVSQAEAQNFVPEGYNVSVMVAGDFYVQVAAAVTAGQKVFASLTDGTVSGGAAGATVSGSIETPFYFVEDGAADDIVIISSNVISAPAAARV